MKGGIYLILAFCVCLCSAQDEIIRTKLSGTGVQADSAWWITGFQTETVGEYVYLRPIRQGGVLLQPVFKSKLTGIAVDGFTTSGDTLIGFSTSGPDASGWVYLYAIMKNSGNYPIFRSKLEGCDVQNVDPVAGQWINKFRTYSDGEYVYLTAVRSIIGIEEDKNRDSEHSIRGFVFALNSPLPNPFLERTKISYSIANPCKVSLRIYDVSGRLVKTLVEGQTQKPNSYTLIWSGTDNQNRRLSSGVYFIRMEAGDFRATKKLMLIR
uniref:T9SS type A sorting domain-containing protein n=1 Tax=candidate division WOR-3 bacterium TaxID=2052148 RepID=A0A7C4TAW4_UNCW3